MENFGLALIYAAGENQLGIYQKELAMLLGVDVTTLVRAEKSDAPSSRLIYGAELLRKKVLLANLTLMKSRKIAPGVGIAKKNDAFLLVKYQLLSCIASQPLVVQRRGQGWDVRTAAR